MHTPCVSLLRVTVCTLGNGIVCRRRLVFLGPCGQARSLLRQVMLVSCCGGTLGWNKMGAKGREVRRLLQCKRLLWNDHV